ncbi:hypothetical protein MVEN_01261900 [Mycena venus]|uniref:Uncharacterized protein n=1 Tax=Mycena venus TaxID=2733690 RepID=A0A8H7CWJ2_9AGAR|nr:hypothetical protein MVEN_01261900 [Mycena venus]
MPRILPRLLKLPLSGNFPFPSKTPEAPRKPVTSLHSFLPADYSRSVLLSPGNVITNSQDYVHHKATAPVPRARRRRIHSRKADVNGDTPREMSAQERVWWSSPYLRMLASPLRRCFLTERYLPSDFMIRLAAFHVPQRLQQKRKGATQMLFPDGLQHPKFKKSRAGHGTYIMCWREALTILERPKLHLLAKHLEALYRTRTGPAPSRPAVLRRLTRAEWSKLRTTGILPFPGALAVLVVPPVNRDPATKERPPKCNRNPRSVPPPPLSVLHPTRVRGAAPATDISYIEPLSDAEFWKRTREERAAAEQPAASIIQTLSKNFADGTEENVESETRVQPHAEERVPLYNGVALFPGRVQRARLHTLLTRILGVEGRSRFSAATRHMQEEEGEEDGGPGTKTKRARGKGDNKGSHAFLVCASDEVDVAALGIALWRIRMWEGGGWRMRVPVRSG